MTIDPTSGPYPPSYLCHSFSDARIQLVIQPQFFRLLLNIPITTNLAQAIISQQEHILSPICNVTLQRLHYVEIPYFINGMSSEGAVDWMPTSLGSLPGLLLCDGCRTGDSEGLSALERGGLQRPWDRRVPMGRALVSSMDFTPPRTIQREAMREALNWTGQRPMQLSSESAWKKASEVSYVDTEQTYGHRAGKRVGGWEAGADMYTLLLLLLSRSVTPDSFATP